MTLRARVPAPAGTPVDLPTAGGSEPPRYSRRRFLTIAGAGVGAAAAAAAGVAWWPEASSTLVKPGAEVVAAAERARRGTGRVVTQRVTAAPTTVDLGGQLVSTWAYDGTLPGPEIRCRLGDTLRVTLDNRLPQDSSIHWHGLELRNDMDGAPPVAGPAVAPGTSFTYDFVVPTAGTYWFHPHTGLQLDRGLYGTLIVEDPAEPGGYDVDAVVVCDDWTDGLGPAPEEIARGLRQRGVAGMAGMGGMGGMAGMGGSSNPLGGDGGDVAYSGYLVNGRLSSAPATVTASPGQRMRLRLVNAGSDTAFRVAVGDHQLTVTHTDGRPVHPVIVDSVLLGMGERYDVVLTAGDGVFPIVASAEGKTGQGLAVLRTGAGTAPPADVRPAQLTGRLLGYPDLVPTDSDALPARRPDRTLAVVLGSHPSAYQWLLNGRSFDRHQPLPVRQGERVRLRMTNNTMMFHPMHVHGHTFAVQPPVSRGARKDTVNVLPMQTVEVDLQADNPGQWAVHCHNTYHLDTGMMTVLSYLT
jgi:multicopper oxidase